MSLTAFNRMRRLKQLEEMKPENIQKQEEKAKIVSEAETAEKIMEEPKTNEAKEATVAEVEETKTSARRGRRAST